MIEIKQYTLKLNEDELETIGNALLEYESNGSILVDGFEKEDNLKPKHKAALKRRKKDNKIAYRLHYEFLKLRKPELAKLYVEKGLVKERGA